MSKMDTGGDAPAGTVGGVEFAETPTPDDVLKSLEPELIPVDPDEGHDAGAPAEPTYDDSNEIDVQGRSDEYIQRGPVEPEIAPASKVRKSKAGKARKAAKARPRPAKVDHGDKPLPMDVHIEFFRGVNKYADAEQLAKGWIDNNFSAPNASFYYIQEWRDGMVVEMQEGGGYAYLPEVLAKLDEDPYAICALGVPDRVVQVRIDHETASLQVMKLPALVSASAGAFAPLQSVKMTPFDQRGSKVFFIGLALLLASAIAMAFAVGGFFIDTRAWALPHLEQTPVASLPSAQTERLTAAAAVGDCVAKMEFRGGQWSFVTGWNNGADVCSSTKPATPIGVDGDTPPTPGDGSALPSTVPSPPVAGATPPATAAAPQL